MTVMTDDPESEAITRSGNPEHFTVFAVRAATRIIVMPILLRHLSESRQHSAFVSRERYGSSLSTLLVQEKQGEMFRNRMSTVLKAR